MQYGVRNKLIGTIEEIRSDEVMSLVYVKVEGLENTTISSVMTTESLYEAGFQKGDKVEALVKAVNVVLAKP